MGKLKVVEDFLPTPDQLIVKEDNIHSKAKVAKLKVLVVGPKNEYEISLVNPEKNSNLKYNFEYTEKFCEFCLSERGQQIIGTFGMEEYGEPIYHPLARKK
jgi:ABC-type tungstate transport system permease subunit